MSIFRKNTPPEKPEPKIVRGAQWSHRNTKLRWDHEAGEIELSVRLNEHSSSWERTTLKIEDAEELQKALGIALEEAKATP